jgi:phage terminase Nu1 subunit (DNA packaging protein)
MAKAAPTVVEEKKTPQISARKSTSARTKAGESRQMSAKPRKPQPENTGSWIREQCTKADLSKLMNLSMRSLRDMDSRGKLVRAPKAGLYMTVATLNACWDHLREVAAGRLRETESPLALERLKNETIERQIREITLKKLKGEVLTLEEVDESWSTFAGMIKSAVLNIPSKARMKIPHLTAHDQLTLRTIAVDMLVDLAAEVDASVIGGSSKDIMA